MQEDFTIQAEIISFYFDRDEEWTWTDMPGAGGKVLSAPEYNSAVGLLVKIPAFRSYFAAHQMCITRGQLSKIASKAAADRIFALLASPYRTALRIVRDRRGRSDYDALISDSCAAGYQVRLPVPCISEPVFFSVTMNDIHLPPAILVHGDREIRLFSNIYPDRRDFGQQLFAMLATNRPTEDLFRYIHKFDFYDDWTMIRSLPQTPDQDEILQIFDLLVSAGYIFTGKITFERDWPWLSQIPGEPAIEIAMVNPGFLGDEGVYASICAVLDPLRINAEDLREKLRETSFTAWPVFSTGGTYDMVCMNAVGCGELKKGFRDWPALCAGAVSPEQESWIRGKIRAGILTLEDLRGTGLSGFVRHLMRYVPENCRSSSVILRGLLDVERTDDFFYAVFEPGRDTLPTFFSTKAELVDEFRARYEYVTVRYEDMNTDQLTAWLRDRDIYPELEMIMFVPDQFRMGDNRRE